MGAAMRAIVANQNDAAASATISRDPRYRSMLRTTCVATMLNGGHARNALPQTATANVNCRMAPGHDPADVRAGLLMKAVGDTGVQLLARAGDGARGAVAALGRSDGSDREGDARRVRSERRRDSDDGNRRDGQQVSPRVGIPGYGVSGLFGDPNDGRAHGKDERVLIKSYYESQEFLYRLVKEMSSGKVIP